MHGDINDCGSNSTTESWFEHAITQRLTKHLIVDMVRTSARINRARGVALTDTTIAAASQPPWQAPLANANQSTAAWGLHTTTLV
eukprot:3044671-Lingulodinium_polyedra.AAC.2